MKKEDVLFKCLKVLVPIFFMSLSLRDLAHQFVLNNISIMSPWLE
jgi:hypothetical protein